MLFEQSSARARACTVAAERGLAEPDESLSVVSLDAHIAESLIDAELYCKVGLSSSTMTVDNRSAGFLAHFDRLLACARIERRRLTAVRCRPTESRMYVCFQSLALRDTGQKIRKQELFPLA